MNLLYKQQQNSKGDKIDRVYPQVKVDVINPKSISIEELYGYFDLDQTPSQWNDGILNVVLKTMVNEPQNVNRWMVLDGPVDTLWIESMNSVLDDSKLLTLNNGDRIGLTGNVRLLFEVENLAVASPATVSRAGMVYLDYAELGFRPALDVWVAGKQEEHGQDFVDRLNELISRYLLKVLPVKKAKCKELIETNESSCVRNLCKLFDAILSTTKQTEEEDRESYLFLVEKIFVFSLIWSIGATVEEQSRKEIDYILRDIESMFPHSNTVYEHHINFDKNRDWAPWEDKISSQTMRLDSNKEFHEIFV
mmetsp:Transcript_75525/g.104475  ORF Transcript_75525/g.104475 Transcript_75525/m.104475 type:complete len:307 (+) Transcript_75525:379-1299(+)